MRSLHDYTVVLRPDDNGTFVAYVTAIDGCHAWGATWEEAQQELANVYDPRGVPRGGAFLAPKHRVGRLAYAR